MTPPLVIVLAATILGLSCNALRPRNGIELGRTYFAAVPDAAAPVERPSTAPTANAPNPPVPTPPSPGALALAARAGAEFELVDAAMLRRFVDAAAVDASGMALLDARDGELFRAGHIPGALHLDYFNVRQDIAPSLPFVQYCVLRAPPKQPLAAPPQGRFASDELIGKPRPVLPLLLVYCESDECEDGFNLCLALRDDYGIDKERILLYLGGMRDWRERRLPVVRGGELW